MLLIIFLLLALILFGAGFAYNLLWIAAVVAVILLVASYFGGWGGGPRYGGRR